MQRIVQRDESALAMVYDRYAGMLLSVLNRILRDKQAAEEILQDIFFQLWRSAERFDGSRGSLPGWLVVVGRNRAISRLRHHNPAAGDELNENTVASAFNLEGAVAQQQLLSRINGALEAAGHAEKFSRFFGVVVGCVAHIFLPIKDVFSVRRL